MAEPEPIAHGPFADGPTRPVFGADGRQWVVGDDGSRVCGVWFVPRDDADPPIVVDTGRGRDGRK